MADTIGSVGFFRNTGSFFCPRVKNAQSRKDSTSEYSHFCMASVVTKGFIRNAKRDCSAPKGYEVHCLRLGTSVNQTQRGQHVKLEGSQQVKILFFKQ